MLSDATSPASQGDVYYGQDRMGEIRGFPAKAKIPWQAPDMETTARLWELSEKLTGMASG